MNTVKPSVLFNNLCQRENGIYTRKSVAETLVVIRFRNMSGFAASIKPVSVIWMRVHVLLEKELIHSNGNKEAYELEII
jgi:hypothetical protein